MARSFGRAKPSELIGLVLALEERDGQDERDRRRLDREIGARYFGEDASDSDTVGLPLLRAWLEESPSPALQGRIARVRSTLGLLRGLLLGLGFFLGWAAAAALLQFEVHVGRINIVLCLGLLVLVPFAMLALAVVGAFWAGRRGADGGTGTGGWRRHALARGAMALLPDTIRQDIEILLGRATAHGRLYAGAQRAQLFVWSQSIGLSFSVGALVATLAFVVFTDLAFGWSTTLDVAAETVHRLVSAIALPWASIWPDAAPSFDLVESTRHFRVSAGRAAPNAAADPHVHFVDPILYGGWWPFLIAALVTYGLLPRFLAVAFGARWLGRETATAMALTPGVDRLLDRLTTPIIETQATGPEAEIGHAERGLVPSLSLEEWLGGSEQVAAGERAAPIVIRWAEASDDETLLGLFGQPGAQVRDAGGRRSLADDAALVAVCRGGDGDVVLCVRAYEPPVLDVLDYLSDLRRAIGPVRRLCVMLLEGDEADHDAWRRKLTGLGDPGLQTVTIARGDAASRSDSEAGPDPDPDPDDGRVAESSVDG